MVLEVTVRSRFAPLVLSLGLPLAGCYWMVWDPDDTDFPETGSYAFTCGRDEIRRLTTGQSFASLAEALADAKEDDAFCIGEGEHDVGVADWVMWEPMSASPGLRLVGSGSASTVLSGPDGLSDAYQARLYLMIAGRRGTIELEGLSLVGAPLNIEAGRVVLNDLRVTAIGGSTFIADIDAMEIEVNGLALAGSGPLGQVPMKISGDGVIRDLSITDNLVSPGYLLQAYGDLTFIDPLVSGNSCINDEIGFMAIEAFGPLHIQGGRFTGNNINGPLIYTWQPLELQDVVFEGNAPGWRGMVTLESHGVVSGGSVKGNFGGSGAFELCDGCTLQINGVDFGIGEDRNEPCDVAANLTGGSHVICLADELGGDATASCDREGCL